MAVGFRCSVGHAWAAPNGHTPTTCPHCGSTELVYAGQVADEGATLAFSPQIPLASKVDTSSFASLLGMPADAMPTADPDSVVPFGEAVDFVPPLVPGYEILAEVGRGGMGVVYKARQLSLNRPVALKMILAGSHAGTVERERFRREAEAVATLQNPHIVQIFEIGEANGHLYLALEFVEGGNLAQHLKGALWSAREAAVLVEVLSRAMQYAHNQGVVHRDLKPGNVLLRSGERAMRNAGKDGAEQAAPARTRTAFTPKITDFGLAKRLGDSGNPDGTKTGAVMGTPSYIAPEQASGKTKDVGPPADVYALGAILYELLTGRPPFMGETPLDTVLQVLHDDPVPPKRIQPTVPRDLETICLKCLNKSPAKRYPSADALGDDLVRFLRGEPIKARPLSPWGRGVKWARRHPSLAILGTFTVVATVALFSVLSVAYARVREAVTLKDAEAKRAENSLAQAVEARARAQQLADENEERRKDAVKRNEDLRREADRTRRGAFALQLAQIAAMAERDPRRAKGLLDNEARCPPPLRDFTWAYLHRLCEREERVYAEHPPATDALHAVAFSPNGTFVATAGKAGQVRVWDSRTGQTWAVLVGHVGQVNGVAFSPDGTVVAACGADHSVRFWELPVGVLEDARRSVGLLTFLQPVVQPLTLSAGVVLNDAHPGEVNCVAFSPDGRYVVSGGEDGFLRWWDLSGWRTTAPAVAALGGPTAAALTVERAAQLTHPVALYREVDAHIAGKDQRGVRALAFAASGKVLVSGGVDRAARVWAPDGANLIRTIRGHADTVRAVAVSPDGRTAVTVNNGTLRTIRVVDVETTRDIRRLTGHTREIYALAMSPEGDLLASVGFDKSLRLWSMEDGQERSILLGHELAVSGAAFAPDRRTVVSVGIDATARVWHTTARPFESADAARDATLTAVAFSGSGTGLFGGDERGLVQASRSDVIPVRPGTSPGAVPFYLHPVMTNRLTGKVKATAASQEGLVVAASTEEGALFVWRVLRMPGGRVGGPGLPLHRPTPLRAPLPVYAMAIDPTGHWLATLDADGVRVWDLRALPLVHPDEKPIAPDRVEPVYRVRRARELAFHPSGTRLAVAVENGVQLLDWKGGRATLAADVPQAHAARVEALTFSKEGDQLATSDANGVIRVWKVEADSLLPLAELSGHTGAVFALAFSPDGRTLASGGDDRAVLLWDPVTGQERAVLTGHADMVLRVQFLPDSSALLSVSRDGSVKRWRSVGGAQSVPPRPPSPPRPAFTPNRG